MSPEEKCRHVVGRLENGDPVYCGITERMGAHVGFSSMPSPHLFVRGGEEMSYTGDFNRDLDIIHDILADATSRIDIPDEHRLIRGKVQDLGDMVASTRERPLVQMTHRQRRLLWEVVTMVDVDTLDDNLLKVEQEVTDQDELNAIADVLDPDGAFQREWDDLEDCDPGTTE